MTDINNLNTPGEPLDEMSIDYDAPEPGSFPPAIQPGTYTGVFTLDADTPFDEADIQGNKVLQVTHGARITVDGEEKDLNFFRASWYRSEKMRAANMNSSAGELTRALGIVIKGRIDREQWKSELRKADGRKQFTAEYGWELYCKNCGETTVSTTPNKKKKQAAWPRNEQGVPTPFVSCPKCHGEKKPGNVRIVRYKLADKATTVASNTQQSEVFAGATTTDSPFS